MDRLIASNSVPMAQADTAPLTGTPQGATDGNPASSVPATRWPSYQYNAIQEELIAILTAAGITPNRTNNAQIVAGIRRLIQSTVVLNDTGAANAYAATNPTPLAAGASATWVDGVVQQVKIANTNTGASTYAPDGLPAIPIYGLGLKPLQGGELAAGGTAILMHATIAGVNSGNPICVLMECAGGAQQIPPATASQHAITAAQAAGVVGSVRSLAMGVAPAGASATMTADEIVVETALGGIRYCLSSFNKTINLATTGAGGMDTGSAPIQGFVALYAIYNPTTQTAALLATNAATRQGSVYGGANMPAGYTASALVSIWPTNSSGQFIAATQRDRTFYFASTAVLSSSTTQASFTALLISGVIPANAISISGSITSSGSTTTTIALSVAADAVGSGAAKSSFGTSGAQAYTVPFQKVGISNPQNLYYSSTNTAGTPTFVISLSAYEI